MRQLAGTFALVGSIFLAPPAVAQTPQAPGEADPGVRPTRLIDRAEIRVSRVEIQAGATRRVHTHDDVEYHVWVPLEGSFQITIGSEPGERLVRTRCRFCKVAIVTTINRKLAT